MPDKFAARPNTLPWPPILYLVAFMLAYALGRLYPMRIPDHAVTRDFGYLTTFAGAAFDLWAAITLSRQRTTILPHRAADHLVTCGPFRMTRNPIYLGNTIAILGLALAFGNAWLIVFGLLAAVFVDRLAIRREEAHLLSRFGSVWSDYAKRTPRWLFG
jgi:protein-S-isoprenylcysteine O-methyltransferase Ste14